MGERIESRENLLEAMDTQLGYEAMALSHPEMRKESTEAMAIGYHERLSK